MCKKKEEKKKEKRKGKEKKEGKKKQQNCGDSINYFLCTVGRVLLLYKRGFPWICFDRMQQAFALRTYIKPKELDTRLRVCTYIIVVYT